MLVTKAGNFCSFIKCYFMKFLNKLNLKNTVRYIRIYNVQGNPKLTKPALFYVGFRPNFFSEYFDLTLELN